MEKELADRGNDAGALLSGINANCPDCLAGSDTKSAAENCGYRHPR